MMRALLRGFLVWWTPIAQRLLEVQTVVILTLLYVTVVGPLAVAARLCRKDLLGKRLPRNAPTCWQDKPPLGEDPARYRHQF